MAHINTALLIYNATDLGHRACEVQQDPAVQKAWRDAGLDVSRAAKSLSRAATETRSAWHRTASGRGEMALRLA